MKNLGKAILREIEKALWNFTEENTMVPSKEEIQLDLTTSFTNLIYPPKENQIVLIADGSYFYLHQILSDVALNQDYWSGNISH